MDRLDYLSKSAFILGKNCRTKMYYRKLGYEENISAMGEQLILDGYKIGKFAQIIYSPGITIKISDGLEAAIQKTEELLLQNDNVTIFEATFLVEGKLVIVDVLQKAEKTLFIKEVKSRSLYRDGKRKDKGKNNQILTDWLKYYLDIAFQYSVLNEYNDKNNLGYEIKPYLVLVDNTVKVNEDGLSLLFDTIKDFDETRFKSDSIHFIGDEEDIKQNNILLELDVLSEVVDFQSEVKDLTNVLLNDLLEIKKGVKYESPLNVDCKKCEFKIDEKSGFDECWGKLAKIRPHIFELYQGTRMKEYFDELIKNQKVSLYDIDQNKLTTGYGERQKIQINFTKQNKSWFSDELRELINTFAYPLSFIDFETARLVIPPFKEMCPYDLLAFQWSVHTIEKRGEAPVHFEFLYQSNDFPNYDFAKSLMETIKGAGTIFMWFHHETTVLNAILKTCKENNIKDSKLIDWLTNLTTKGYIKDMCKLTEQHFYHPDMEGSNSLKKVLPSIWKNYTSINADGWFKEYLKEVGGKILNPYAVLPKEDVIEQSEIIMEGTGAIIGYQNYLLALANGKIVEAEKWKNLLLQYCKLDTMAMVIVWKHWINLSKSKSQEFNVKD